jgi:sec-independent protein translocase protein TatB
MFDISFAEIVVIAVVGLIVVGPERLPKVARTVGYLLGRAQRYVADVKSDIQREMELEEFKKLKASMEGAARSMEETIRTEISEIREVTGEKPEESLMEKAETKPVIVSDTAAEPLPEDISESAIQRNSAQPDRANRTFNR